ncbi:hypothetical protein IMAU20035_02214 [Lactobacillus helveticus]|nr:hypothetical protein [Lactobacillus helveticus]
MDFYFLKSVQLNFTIGQNNKDQMFPQMCGILYVMCMSIFTNPFYFSITDVMIFIMLFKSLKFGKNQMYISVREKKCP